MVRSWSFRFSVVPLERLKPATVASAESATALAAMWATWFVLGAPLGL
jgi:hypothetical protein